MKRVLLVSHETSLTGAPRIGVLVGRALVGRGHRVRVLVQRPGPLLDDFREVAPTRVAPLWRVLRRLWAHPGPVSSRAVGRLDVLVATAVVALHRPDLVYVNSSSSAAFVRAARLLRREVVLHVHESGPVLDHFLERVGIDALPSAGARLVACSPSVADDLVSRGVPREDVTLILSIPDETAVRAAALPREHARPDAVVVGCCGAVEHRKGVDLWLDAVRSLETVVPPGRARFVWVGQGQAPPHAEHPTVEFTGPTSDPARAMARFDIMTLPSRDDPFPLVVMEAMLLGKPVVAFDVGGVRHQLGDTGVLVPPGDVDGFAAEVARLVNDPEARVELGERAAARARSLFTWTTFERAVATLVDGDAVTVAQARDHRGEPAVDAS